MERDDQAAVFNVLCWLSGVLFFGALLVAGIVTRQWSLAILAAVPLSAGAGLLWATA